MQQQQPSTEYKRVVVLRPSVSGSQRDRSRQLRVHHRRLNNMRPTLNTYNEDYLVQQRRQRRNRRRNRVDEMKRAREQRENEILVKKITGIVNQTRWRWNPGQSAKQRRTTRQLHSLNRGRRLQQQRKIHRENIALGKRIMGRQPTVSRNSWYRHARRHNKLLRNMSRFIVVDRRRLASAPVLGANRYRPHRTSAGQSYNPHQTQPHAQHQHQLQPQLQPQPQVHPQVHPQPQQQQQQQPRQSMYAEHGPYGGDMYQRYNNGPPAPMEPHATTHHTPLRNAAPIMLGDDHTTTHNAQAQPQSQQPQPVLNRGLNALTGTMH